MTKILLPLLLALPAHAAQVGAPFEITGSITNFYGGPKSAEADMWARAFQTCKNLEGERGALLLNRVSDVTQSHARATDFAKASFVCVVVGNGN